MKTKSVYLFLICASFAISSCAHRLVGTWTVKKYESASSGNNGVSVQNAGSISFDKDGTGQKEMNYTVLGMERDDSTPFEWSATESEVTIESEDSDLSKTWIIMKNERKNQKWKSTDGKNKVQTLVLEKQ